MFSITGCFSSRNRTSAERGFSLVELLVALVFTGILMAGMATVFKSSINVFSTSGERMGSHRRNRATIDLLSDDLNNAAQFLTQMDSIPAWVSLTQPCFAITPGTSFTASDQLVMAYDEVVPCDATATFGNMVNQDQMVSTGALSTALPTLTLTFADLDQAKLLKQGQFIIFKDAYEPKVVGNVGTPTSTSVTVPLDATMTDAKGAATGNTGASFSVVHGTTKALIVNSQQTITYRIETRQLDPENAAGIPCLIRDQNGTTTIVAENVNRIKVAVSLDQGVSWYPNLGAQEVLDWSGITAKINSYLATNGRQNFQTINGLASWVREVPMLVRVDVTTLTSKARSDYSADGQSLQKKEMTQSLILMPRYFGLSYFS